MNLAHNIFYFLYLHCCKLSGREICNCCTTTSLSCLHLLVRYLCTDTDNINMPQSFHSGTSSLCCQTILNYSVAMMSEYWYLKGPRMMIIVSVFLQVLFWYIFRYHLHRYQVPTPCWLIWEFLKAIITKYWTPYFLFGRFWRLISVTVVQL